VLSKHELVSRKLHLYERIKIYLQFLKHLTVYCISFGVLSKSLMCFSLSLCVCEHGAKSRPLNGYLIHPSYWNLQCNTAVCCESDKITDSLHGNLYTSLLAFSAEVARYLFQRNIRTNVVDKTETNSLCLVHLVGQSDFSVIKRRLFLCCFPVTR